MSDGGTTGKSGDSKTVTRPMPPRTELSQGFWDAVARGELAVQRCEACGLLRHYPQLRCPACQSAEVSWQPLSGEGEIHSYTVAHRAFHPAWKEHAPYVIATIELDEFHKSTAANPVDLGSWTLGDPLEFEGVPLDLNDPNTCYKSGEGEAVGCAVRQLTNNNAKVLISQQRYVTFSTRSTAP